MWIFDGEEWKQEGGSADAPAPSEAKRPRYDEFTPELQVIEIVPLRKHPQPLPLDPA